MLLKIAVTVLLSAALIHLAPTQASPAPNIHKQAVHTQVVKAVPQAIPTNAITAVQPQPEAVETPQTPEPGTPNALMAAAGIPTSDWAAASYIVQKESNWNTTAVNPSSGSCGLVQELPCGKSGCELGDGVCQLRWATQYATQRYGSWWSAQAFWSIHLWW